MAASERALASQECHMVGLFTLFVLLVVLCGGALCWLVLKMPPETRSYSEILWAKK